MHMSVCLFINQLFCKVNALVVSSLDLSALGFLGVAYGRNGGDLGCPGSGKGRVGTVGLTCFCHDGEHVCMRRWR